MGKVMSMVSRQVNRFNIESRAQRVLEREKPIPAPKYQSNMRDMQRALEADPELVDKLNRKDADLDERLKNVYVTSEDSFIDYAQQRKEQPDKPLPLDRTTPADYEYGFQEPKRVTRGRFTLRQGMKFLMDHQSDPEVWTAKKISDEYKLKPELVENILHYFKGFNVYIPDKGQKERILTQTKSKSIEGGND